MQLRSRTIPILIALILLAACGVTDTGGVTQPTQPAPTAVAAPTPMPTPTAVPAPTQTAPTAAPTQTAPTQTGPIQTAPQPTIGQPIPIDVLVIYHKSGGFVGIDETLTVHADGKLELHTRRTDTTGQADATTLSALQKLLSSPEFASLQSPTGPLGADQFVYELIVPGNAQTIKTIDGAENPPLLDAAIKQLNALRQTVGPAKG